MMSAITWYSTVIDAAYFMYLDVKLFIFKFQWKRFFFQYVITFFLNEEYCRDMVKGRKRQLVSFELWTVKG